MKNSVAFSAVSPVATKSFFFWMVFGCKLSVVHLDFYLGCAEAKTKDLEQVGHALADYGAEGRISVVLDSCGA